MFKQTLLLISAFIVFNSCKKESEETPAPTPTTYNLIFKYKFDSTQTRLNNFGQPSTIPSGHGAQSPRFNKMSSHYIELAQGDLTPLGGGKVLYRAAETTAGGANAIDFSQSTLTGDGETFFSVPLTDAVGTYKWLRVSLAYQNYDINFKSLGFYLEGTIASFIGYNTYITSFAPKNKSITVNDDKLQGYWAFELNAFGQDTVFTGEAGAGNTTVPNPNPSSPVPAGSCVVTGQFASPLTITGNETHDIVVIVSLSTNNSFEWTDVAGDNIYEPPGDVVIDMGIRGLVPIVQ